jgi:hypothetical protein
MGKSIIQIHKKQILEQMKITLIFILSLVFFACNEEEKSNIVDELDQTIISEKAPIESVNFINLLNMEPNEISLSSNKFKSNIDKGFLSNEEVFELIYSKHALSENSKLTLLHYSFIDTKQKWTYRINSTRKLIIKEVKVLEAIKTTNTNFKIEKPIFEMTKVF